jgi:hypothetical protein
MPASEKAAPAAVVPEPVDLKALRAEIAELGEEWRDLYREDSSNPRCRELRRLLNLKSRLLLKSEPKVQVDVPWPVTGRAFIVGGTEFPAGRYVIPASVAEYLTWLIDQDRVEELRIKYPNTHPRRMDPKRGDILNLGMPEVFLGNIGDIAQEV